jgi:UDP-glucose 4-epimerase
MNSDQSETILVTGANGALARAVIAQLMPHYNLVAVDFRRKPDFGVRIPSYAVTFTNRIFEDIFRSHHITGVIHLGRVGVHDASRQSRYTANVMGTQKLLDYSRKYGVGKVLILSTFFVYGANAYNPALLTEESPLLASGLTRDLVDSVELENLSNIYLYKYPELNISILRPCHIAGPGIRNSMSRLLSQNVSPVLMGFAPLMQFIHISDMADAIILAFRQHRKGIFNVAPDDWIPYPEALEACGCTRLPVPSIPPFLIHQLSEIMRLKSFPNYLINFLKYPVILDGRKFRETFSFKPKKNMRQIFKYYSRKKK